MSKYESHQWGPKNSAERHRKCIELRELRDGQTDDFINLRLFIEFVDGSIKALVVDLKILVGVLTGS